MPFNDEFFSAVFVIEWRGRFRTECYSAF